MTTSVENEWLCSRIVASFGLPVARTEIGTFEERKALVVERFDRRLAPEGTCWLRLPQEDFCQALKAPASLKYESDGGPGIRPIMDLLLGSRAAGHDRLLFLRTQVVFWLLCALDGHAKNFSVAIEPEGRFALTPLYDVLSAWPIIGRGQGKLARANARMAMAAISKNGHYHWDGIQPCHWLSTAHSCGVDSGEMTAILQDLVEKTPRVIADIEAALPAGFPEAVGGPILRGMAFAAKRLEKGLSAV